MNNQAFLLKNDEYNFPLLVTANIENKAVEKAAKQFPNGNWRVHTIFGRLAEDVYTSPLLNGKLEGNKG